MDKRLQEMLFDCIGPYPFRDGVHLVAFGRTMNDPRAVNGTTLRSSPIQRVWLEKGKMFIETENTVYFVKLEI